jgi:hypothetical protein
MAFAVRRSQIAIRRSPPRRLPRGFANREWLTANGDRAAAASSHTQFVRRLQGRSTTAANDGRAIAAGKRIPDFHSADRAVEHYSGFPGVRRCFRGDLHDHDHHVLRRARNCNTILGCAHDRLLGRFAEDQIAFDRGQRDGKLPDFVLHPDADNKILTLFPRADPLVAG